MKTSSRPKSKLSVGIPTPKNNNFSEKYFQYTRERKFFTPKKTQTLKNDTKETIISKKEIL